MILEIEGVLTQDAVTGFMDRLATAPWVDGKVTAGYQSALAKNNLQLPEDCSEAIELARVVTEALARNLQFQSAALPHSIFPPLFNRYAMSHAFGVHIDNAIRIHPASGARLRTDLSCTLFLSDPASYDGGELIIEEGSGERRIKLAAGSMVLYPSTTLHSVTPVTRGARIASFFWVQSLIADQGRRSILFDIDIAIQSLRQRLGDNDPALIALTGSYHNLLRQWSIP